MAREKRLLNLRRAFRSLRLGRSLAGRLAGRVAGRLAGSLAASRGGGLVRHHWGDTGRKQSVGKVHMFEPGREPFATDVQKWLHISKR